MNRLFRLFCSLLLATQFLVLGCGESEPIEVPPEEDPALTVDGNPDADSAGKEYDPAATP